MLKGICFAILSLMCGAVFADSIEMGKKVYSDVVISGATKDKIWFLQTDSVNTSKPLENVTKLNIESFSEFNRAEELADQGQFAQAMKQYLASYKAVKNIKDEWSKMSVDNLAKGRKTVSETYDANAKSEWIKDLIKFRYSRAKGMQSGEIEPAAAEEKSGASGDASEGDAKFCPECRGKGKIKCARCNGSGKQKCTHNIDGEKHANYYEICPKCNGKGFEIERYSEEVWVPNPNHSYYHNSGHYEMKQKTRKVPCSGDGCKPYKPALGKTIYVTWICPYCANSSPVGYVDCPYCQKGRLECTKCGGTGKIANNGKAAPAAAATVTPAAAVVPAAEENELASPNALLNSLEKSTGEKLPKSPYKEYTENELKRQKDRETFDQTIDPFIIASQKYSGTGVTWKATVERVSKVQKSSFIITANFVRDNANADVWTIKAIVPAQYVETGAKLSTNSPVEITGKISGIDYKYETITLNADEIKVAD